MGRKVADPLRGRSGHLTKIPPTGSITPVEPGRMRNTWYPQQKAEYVTASRLQGLKPQKMEVVRDFTFGMSKPEAEPVPASTQAEPVPPTLTVTRLLQVPLPTSPL